MADTRVILLIFYYVACLNANDLTPSTMTTSTHSENPNDLQPQVIHTTESTSVASVTEATKVPLYISTTISTNKTQSVQTSSSPTASKSVTKPPEPDPTTATSNNTVIQSISTTTTGTVTKPQPTLSEMSTHSTEHGLNKTAASTETGISPSEEGDSGHQSKEETKSKSFDGRYLWLLLLVVAVLAAGMFLKFRCCKIHHHPVENIDHGTENASFQRTESKDGVMLLGVKSGGEENVAAK